MNLPRRHLLRAMAGVPAAVALGSAIRPTTADAATATGTATPEPATAYIDVSLATLWVSPGNDRLVDLPSTTNPDDPGAWMAQMSLADRVWLVGHLETQAAYGRTVRILEESGDWAHVAVVGQPTPRNTYGYPGWMPKVQLATGGNYGNFADMPFAMVTANKATLYHDPHQTDPFMELSFNTRLPVLSRTPHGVLVATPSDGTKWFRSDDVAVYGTEADIPYPKADDLVDTGMMFIGTHYLWAGVSSWGFDCSGFTSTVYSAHGITIPRDAGPQYNAGVKVAREELQTGDLIFFARNNGKGSIHHVGMYCGDGTIIDAPGNTSTVESPLERVPLVEHRYITEYAGASRYLV